MPSTAISRIAIAALFAISTTAVAKDDDKPPRYLAVPALGLRLPIEGIKLEPFPEDLLVKCPGLEDETVTSRVWVFGRARNAGATYYVAAGYSKWLNTEPGDRSYGFWDDGNLYIVTGAECTGTDAGEAFDAQDPNPDDEDYVPIPIRKALALDLAARTVGAFGGAEQLRTEIKNQRIDFNQLSPELQDAFKPYFEPVK